jgi:ribosomal protein S12 methylthiotransferase
MRRPASEARTLERIQSWRRRVPDLTLRSSFIVGFPGETDEDFDHLLDWLHEAKLDRVGCFRYEPVTGASANELPNAVPSELTDERWHRLMSAQQAISRERLAEKIGQTIEVIVDAIDDAPWFKWSKPSCSMRGNPPAGATHRASTNGDGPRRSGRR